VKPLIIVADDHEALRFMLRSFLRSRGFRVLTARTGRDALALCRRIKHPYRDEALARWQDSRHRFDLIRSSEGPSFRLIGVLKRLEEPAQAATPEAKRLDDQEAPQRDAARLASEQKATATRLEKPGSPTKRGSNHDYQTRRSPIPRR